MVLWLIHFAAPASPLAIIAHRGQCLLKGAPASPEKTSVSSGCNVCVTRMMMTIMTLFMHLTTTLLHKKNNTSHKHT